MRSEESELLLAGRRERERDSWSRKCGAAMVLPRGTR